MCLTLLSKLLKSLPKSEELPKPSSTEEIEVKELSTILRQRFPKEGQLFLSDQKYKLCNVRDIRTFCTQDKTNHVKYESEWMDCDDFAYRLMGQLSIPEWSKLAFGIVWTNLHALNCFIGEDKLFYFLEPQKDTIQTQLEAWQGSTVRFIVM